MTLDGIKGEFFISRYQKFFQIKIKIKINQIFVLLAFFKGKRLDPFEKCPKIFCLNYTKIKLIKALQKVC
jgi:hypothetical protein